MNKQVYLLAIAFLFLTLVQSKHFRRCEFARALASSGVPREFISNYVCLAETVSGLDTDIVKKSKTNPKVSNLGIFQIPSSEWCGINGKCNLPCEKLVDSDVRDDIQCAMKIQTAYGFKNWPKWLTRCKSNDSRDPNKFLPNLHNCGH
ncbi:hypothetical protein PVAND_008477 [Polypedilum vanderplanki]|uniref:lysozyme n=1 Tax=Polypedilum vanderplanki TaxID=319348 RepID=A0A9J6C9M8_POLVA|nr:hypothetical protein PVAND_008477 [Polypedilum vanderplanki]